MPRLSSPENDISYWCDIDHLNNGSETSVPHQLWLFEKPIMRNRTVVGTPI